MIDQVTVDRILDTADIVEVISEFVTLRRAGVSWKGLCPFHSEKTASFLVSPGKGDNGLFHCFGCGKKGNVAHFLMYHEQMNYVEALRWLAKKYHIEIHERDLTPEDIRQNNLRESLLIVNDWACKYFQENLSNTEEGESIGMNYFRHRGLREDIIKTFGLGYCLNSTDALYKEAKAKGYSEEFLLAAGLCTKSEHGGIHDKYRGRVIFPFHAIDGHVTAFGARTLSSDKNIAKYMNSPESIVYDKSQTLYGIYQAKAHIQKEDHCYLVEGYLDVISMYQSGVCNVVASSGTSLTKGQIPIIRRFSRNITVIYDGDSAGIHASLRAIDLLLEEGMNISLLLLPDGDDPDSFARKHDAEEYREYMKTHQVDFIRFKADILLADAAENPVKKSQAVHSIVESIALIPDAFTRSAYIKQCVSILNEREDILVHEVTLARSRNWKEKQKEQERERARAEAQNAEDNIQATTEDTEGNPENNVPQVPVEEPLTPEQSLVAKKEEQLIQLIVRYGEHLINYLQDSETGKQTVNVISYIHSELDADDIHFQTPLYERIYQEACLHSSDANFNAPRLFTHSADPIISTAAVNFLSDRYQLSENFAKERKIISESERLNELLPMLIIDLKLAVVTTELKKALDSLESPEILANPELMKQQMEKYQTLKQLQKRLNAAGGKSTITL